MAETPEGREVDYAGTKGPHQRDGSYGYHLLNIYKAVHPSTNQKNRPFDIRIINHREATPWRSLNFFLGGSQARDGNEGVVSLLLPVL